LLPIYTKIKFCKVLNIESPLAHFIAVISSS